MQNALFDDAMDAKIEPVEYDTMNEIEMNHSSYEANHSTVSYYSELINIQWHIHRRILLSN